MTHSSFVQQWRPVNYLGPGQCLGSLEMIREYFLFHDKTPEVAHGHAVKDDAAIIKYMGTRPSVTVTRITPTVRRCHIWHVEGK